MCFEVYKRLYGRVKGGGQNKHIRRIPSIWYHATLETKRPKKVCWLASFGAKTQSPSGGGWGALRLKKEDVRPLRMRIVPGPRFPHP